MREDVTVTCLCITRGRPEFLPHAVDCFMRLEYQNAELLIVADHDDDTCVGSGRIILSNTRQKIRVVKIQRPETLGEKRNMGCNLAAGKFIAIWDDDDYSSPERLHHQLNLAARYGKSVVAYNTMKFTDGTKWMEYQGIPSVGVGTSLLFKKSYWENHKFPAKNLAEDNDFILDAVRAREYKSDVSNDMMFASLHPNSTSPHDFTPGAGFVPVACTPPAHARPWLKTVLDASGRTVGAF